MNNEYLYIIYIASIFIHIVALMVALAFVIPLQIKEAKVKNGLAKLRMLMLMSGLTLVFLNIASIIALSIPVIFQGVEYVRIISVITVFLHSLGFLAFALIKRQMYREQYSDQQKDLHKKFAKEEKDELTRKNKHNPV